MSDERTALPPPDPALEPSPAARVAAEPARPVRRLTGLLVTLLVLVATCGWGWVVHLRTTERPAAVLPMGESWHQDDGSRVRLVKWQQPATLDNFSGKPVAPAAGSSWVVATLDFDDATDDTLCDLVLRGPGGTRWSTQGAALVESANPSGCQGATTNLVDLVAQVPTERLDEVRGVGFDHGPAWHQPPVLARP